MTLSGTEIADSGSDFLYREGRPLVGFRGQRGATQNEQAEELPPPNLATHHLYFYAGGRERVQVSIKLNGYVFEGPYGAISSLEDRSGVYAILTKNRDAYHVLDIGESAEVKTRIDGHRRAECWRSRAIRGIYFAVYYTPNLQQSGRMQIEQKLRAYFDPPCGKQ